ncbi:iron ABC transporter permease [Kaistia dalseonensis]|uniref:Iron(III) transport system permease protein n=1 Tax=Kaistia dalseonensis TaxID=410840 RepID=A0ABU0H8A7_9HYPH|nr:iron ABC transporter permease [Kaistia dalseonensis]MCX5495942.1 iron ABC transporter permease [Kaistia dalseonensis]MDQ0438545.1 iron(III) transport system permease protein [Kaistia dalseonensis]
MSALIAGEPQPDRRNAWPGAGERLFLVGSALAALMALAPILGLVYFALRGSGALWPHLIANVLPAASLTTLLLLLGVGTIVTIIGVGTAWLVAMHRFPGRRLFEWALLLPLAVPSYVMAFAYLDVAHPVGPIQSGLRALFGITDPRGLPFPEIRSLGGAIFLLGVILYPYVYLPVRALFLMQSTTLLDAARTLGAGPGPAFLHIALPMARPAIAIGVSLALLETLNDIGASEFLGVRTLTVAIYTTWVTRSSIEGASQIALVMLAIVFALLLLERHARRHLNVAATPRGGRQPTERALRPLAALLAMLACFLPIMFGFVVPASYLVLSAWQRIGRDGLPGDLWLWVGNSLTVASIATVLTILLGLFLASAARMIRNPGIQPLIRLSGIGYAIPGTVLAVGLLVPLAGLDNLIANGVRSLTGNRIGLVLIGSGMALILAYSIRFLTIATGGIESGFARISPSVDMAARILGATPQRLTRDIHVPLLSPAIAAAAMLVFVDCMKELPATLLLRPLNFETLATHVYGEAARGTYEDGAIAALAIVLVGMIPVIILARTGTRGRAGAAWFKRRVPASP